MRKINTKKIMFALFIVVLILSISTISLATLPDIKPQYGDGADQARNVAGYILGIIQIIAVAVATIMLVVLGAKYIYASPTEKAEIKKGMFIYIVGALLLYGGAGVLNVIKGFAKDINSASGAGSSSSSSSQQTTQKPQTWV